MSEEEDWSKEQEANRKPGQKYPTPSPGHADRVFYESLLQQRPESDMAKKWCLEYGVLKWTEAETLCKEMGVTCNVGRALSSKAVKLKKQKMTSSANGSRRTYDESATAEAMEMSSNGYDGVGLGAL